MQPIHCLLRREEASHCRKCPDPIHCLYVDDVIKILASLSKSSLSGTSSCSCCALRPLGQVCGETVDKTLAMLYDTPDIVTAHDGWYAGVRVDGIVLAGIFGDGLGYYE